MANRILNTQVAIQKITATATPAENVYNLTQPSNHEGGGSLNLLPRIIEFNTTLGNVTIHLFALSTLMVGGSMGLGFRINGSIVAGGNQVIIVPYSAEDEVNTVCGNSLIGFSTVGSAFMLYAASSTNWGLFRCAPLN